KIEIKNMNTFSGVRRVIEYEVPRQIEVVKNGGSLRQETRRWDDVAGITEIMRTKEDAHDYRYFPEPDLMPLAPTDEWIAEVRTRVVELPLARKQRFMRDYQLPAGDAEVFKNDVALGNRFVDEVKCIPSNVQGEQRTKKTKAIANWVINNFRAKLAETATPITGVGTTMTYNTTTKPPNFQELVEIVDSGKINLKIAQEIVFPEVFDTGKAPAVIVQERGLAQVSDTGAIEKFCDDVIAANPGPASDFKSGKVAALNFLKGQVMKLSKGKANPGVVGEILERKLKT
ncbi:MAG: Asp-tRNA(Asn)/Glu-tRNA(Gln) amidotransferase GatCAB subunit B, partial [Verrucomicrobia bacterium]|nr:Asp-tRNA(Asn)/Glu-tRNA(Gln) amidotransferase GatCAB subunit B [Verrucomicrobiota bacterium]